MSMLWFPFALLWVAWFIYWRVSARNTKPNERVESRASRLSHTVPLIAGAVMLNRPLGASTLYVLPVGLGPYFLGLLLCALGLGFTVWARVHLGANWSDTVSRKQGHELVSSGPYARVRHPIYTGLLLAFASVVIARGDLISVLGGTMMTLGVLQKLRIEERWMTETFGAAYAEYRDRVPALIPALRARAS
jgi:protein-S-isoprenylcysteine O-methyltransferase Ste14